MLHFQLLKITPPWCRLMRLIPKRSSFFLILALMNKRVIIFHRIPEGSQKRQNIKSIPMTQEVHSHAMTLLEKPTGAFNVYHAELRPASSRAAWEYWAKASVGQWSLSQPRNLQVGYKPCLTWCNKHGSRSDKDSYKKTHPLWLWGHSGCSGHSSYILCVTVVNHSGDLLLLFADMYSTAWLLVFMTISFSQYIYIFWV